jgi:hypothetical protein
MPCSRNNQAVEGELPAYLFQDAHVISRSIILLTINRPHQETSNALKDVNNGYLISFEDLFQSKKPYD